MATEVLLPKLSFAMEEGRLAEWLVPDGASVTQGQPLCSLECEKALEELEAPASGTLRIVVPMGEVRPIGTVLATID